MSDNALDKNNNWVLFLLTLASCFLVLFIRAWYVTDIGDLLRIEDGIFISQAREWGTYSLLAPHAGYFHTAIRFLCLGSSFLDFSYIPFFLLSSVLILYALSIFLVFMTLSSFGVKPLITYCALVLLFAQPLGDDLLLNITNTQWYMGAAFIIYALGYQKQNYYFNNAAIGLIFGLSGPFSLILMPILLVRYYFDKQKKNKELVLYTLIAVSIQIGIIILLRFGHVTKPITLTIPVVFETLRLIVLGYVFKGDTYYSFILLIIIFIATGYAIAKTYKLKHKLFSEELIVLILFLIFTIVILGIAFITALTSSPIDYAAFIAASHKSYRYMYIPHCLLIVGTLIVSHHYQKFCLLIIACFSIISFLGFNFMRPDKVHFSSFVNLSNYIKTNAVINGIGGKIFPRSIWFVKLQRDHYKHLSDSRITTFDLADLKFNNAQVSGQDNTFHIVFSAANTPNSTDIEFLNPVDCANTSDLAVDFRISSSVPVKIEFSARPWDRSSPVSSMAFFHGLDEDTQQLAIPHIEEKAKINLKLTAYAFPQGSHYDKVETNIKNLKLFCLPPNN